MDKQQVICYYCKTQFEEKPKRTLLSFQKFKCPNCSKDVIYPLTSGHKNFYWILLFILVFMSIGTLVQGGIPIPGGLGIIAIVALTKNQNIKNKIDQIGKEV